MATPEDDYKNLPAPYRVGMWLRLVAFLIVVTGMTIALVVRGWSFYFVPGLLAALALVPTRRETLAERLIETVGGVLRARRRSPPLD